MKTYLLEVY